MKKVLITGCPRSGTKYIAIVLNAFGYPIGWEKMEIGGLVDWEVTFWDTEKLLYKVKPVQSDIRIQDFDTILHQVRTPLRVIESMHIIDEGNWNKALFSIKEIKKTDSKLLKCMKWWYYWNLKAESIAEWTYKIEDLYSVFDELCKRIEFSYNKEKKKKLLYVDSKITHSFRTIRPNEKNKPQYRNVSWQDLKMEDEELMLLILELAIKYGYYGKEEL